MGRVSEKLIVMTRFPEVGKVKTRLAAGIGEEQACEVHRMLVHSCLEATEGWDGSVEIRMTGGSADERSSWLGGATVRDQGGGDLGARLKRATAAAFEEGAERVVVIGTDCPELDDDLLREAFAGLGEAEVVLGPAADGGYYLIGLSRRADGMFESIPWGGPEVMERSLDRARELGLSVARLRVLRDIDTRRDLEEFPGILRRLRP